MTTIASAPAGERVRLWLAPAGRPLARVFGRDWGRGLVWTGALAPALFLAWQLWRASQGEPHTLGREPVKGLEHATGGWAIRFLLATVAVTPVRQLTGWNWLARYRRVFGLVTFAYATAHLTTYAALDLELNLGDLAHEVVKRPYLVVGFAGWLALVPLALTSTTAWIRRLGGARWNALHRLTYAVAALAVVHFWMSQKKDHREPLLWGAAFALLLGWRLLRPTRPLAPLGKPDYPA